MNWWWLHTLAHLGSERKTALYFIFCVSLKISPALSTVTAEGLTVYPVPRWDLAWFFGGKEEVLSSFVTE